MSRESVSQAIASRVCQWELTNLRMLGHSDGECYFGAYAALEQTFFRGMDIHDAPSVWPRLTIVTGVA